MKRILVAALVVVAGLAVAMPAQAADQTVDAGLSSTLSMDTNPTAAVSGWTLAATGANTTSGGTVGINANQSYTVTVTADQTRLSEWNTAGAAYVASGRTLGAPLNAIAARTGGTAPVPGVGATADTNGTSTLFATGTGLGTDTYSSTLSQVTAITDPTLPAGRTYHVVLTYTLASTL